MFALVGGQLSWALRPYLVRPRTPDVPFVREVEGSLFDAITGAVVRARHLRRATPRRCRGGVTVSLGALGIGYLAVGVAIALVRAVARAG